MRSTVDADPQVRLYLQYVDAAGLGWDLEERPTISMPGFDGSTDLQYARAD
jgi:hypothetical protein